MKRNIKCLLGFTRFYSRIFMVICKRFICTFIVKLQCKEYIKPLYINKYSKVTKNTYFGKNNCINGIHITGGGKVTIGNNFHCGSQCQIITSVHNYEGESLPYDKSYIHKNVVINENVWLGNRVIILGGVTIGEGAIIQAGSVVVNDIPPCAIAGGHPAKVFSGRNKEHYFNLKKANKISTYEKLPKYKCKS